LPRTVFIRFDSLGPSVAGHDHFTPSTVMPMLRALPAIVRTAGIHVGGGQVRHLGLGDFLGLLARELADLVGVGFWLPFSTFAAFLMSTVAGGVFMMNVKLLSAYAVITTGIGRPGSTFCVCALKALQNSMMLRPRCRARDRSAGWDSPCPPALAA
jgi:hypothetical protein